MSGEARRCAASRGSILPRRRVRSSRARDLIARDRLCGVTYRIITDNQGSVRLVVDAETGEVAQRLDYDSFGRVLRDTNPGFQPFGFQGGLYDPDTGLVEFGCRWYDAETGRWISKDPILLEGGWNVYAFCDNDPVNHADPTGLCEDASWIDGFQALLDGAGVFDPTPTCDGINALIYVCRGKWSDAWISVVGIIPYAGDAAKIGKYGVKTAKAFRGGKATMAAVEMGARNGLRYSDDASALIKLSKQAKRNGVNAEDAQTLLTDEHIHIGPVDHIRITP